jgi:glycosyltransferase involved in cell wall biosynthesis
LSLVVVRPHPYGGGGNLALLESLGRFSRIREITFVHTADGNADWGFLDGTRVRLVRCERLNVRLGANLVSVLEGVSRLLRAGSVVDVAEVGNGYAAQVVRAAGKAGVPVIVTVLETQSSRIWDKLPPFSTYTRYVCKRATAFRVLTERSRGYLRRLGVPADRIVRIPVGIDTELFQPRRNTDASGELRILFARRLEPKNGLEMLLRAVGALAPTIPRLRLWVAGDGPSRKRVEEAGASLPVRFLGRLSYPNLAEIYRAADIYCNPAVDTWRLGRLVQEDGQYTFPLLESQASGLPVISTSSGANDELLARGNLTVRQGDLADLESAITTLADDARRAEASRGNRAWIESNFSARFWQPEMDALVERLGG